ncbi:MAG: ABC transporter substrate-binding protein [Gordonia sp. (in: high G+C Gram-positive bacteria)]|uniref:ABC transporter substrate-binding protein n=1 Tax=Gordonia sp. (in: high G+C Gram-positive bacteria) TaxID=84139 RepID=UPI0039E5DCE6
MTARRGIRRLLGAGLVASLTAALAACGPSGPQTINYLIDARVNNYNVNTVDGFSSGAVMALARVLPGFSYLGPDGELVADRDVGTVSMEQGSSLKVTYTFADGAKYSDGQPMACDDIMLAATAMGGHVKGFNAATGAGYRDITNIECTPGGKTAVVTFARGRDYADWRALFGVGALLPAHVVARKAGVANVVDPITKNDTAALAKIADAWNTGFEMHPGKVTAEDFPSAGPYRVAGYTTDKGLELIANQAWWGERPAAEHITVWPRGTNYDTALKDGRIDVVDTADLSAADRMQGRTESTAPQNRAGAKDARPLSVTSLVLSGKGAFADPAMRKAFAACVPRDTLARKYGANGLVWSLRTVAPADSLGSALNQQFAKRYPRADAARARTLLGDRQGEAPGKPTVRIGYVAPDAVDKAIVEDIANSCTAAGIDVTDDSATELTPASLGKDVDVLIANGPTGIAAAGTASGFPAAYQLFGGDGLDLPDFRDAQVSGAVNDLSLTVSDSARLPLLRSIETAAWDSVVSIPLFGTVRAREATDKVQRVVPGMAATGTGWNMDRWTRK